MDLETEDVGTQTEDPAADPQDTEEAAEESVDGTDQETSETGETTAPDGKKNGQSYETRYKALEKEFTRRSQELAEIKRKHDERENRDTEVEGLRKQAAALKNLVDNPEFREWAEERLLKKEIGENVDTDQVKLINKVVERRLAEEREKVREELRKEYEPAARANQENQAKAAMGKVAEKWGDLFEAKKDDLAKVIAHFDKLAEKDPAIRRQMDDVTEDFVESLFLKTVNPTELKEFGRKAYQTDLEKKKKGADVTGRGSVSDKVLTSPKVSSLKEAFAQAAKETGWQPPAEE